ncbi:MAG: hypothetical protein RI897_2553 [Verrucomicrobiota bacterium]|jgi:cation:H+ antiporter
MPRVVVGSTLVSLATTTPEMAVSFFSGISGQSGLAVGNAVGAAVCNLLLILGAMAAVRWLRVPVRQFVFPFGVMLGVGLLLFGWTWDLRLGVWGGRSLFVFGLVYFGVDFFRHWGVKGKLAEQAEGFETEIVSRHRWLRRGWGTAGLFLAGAALVVGGSHLVVGAGVRLALAWGMPPVVLGLTVLAVGTSLPEVVTAVTSARQDVPDLALGNLLGANIANLTLIVGGAAGLHEVVLEPALRAVMFPGLVFAAGLVGVLVWCGGGVTRRGGLLLVMCYLVYLASVAGVTILA